MASKTTNETHTVSIRHDHATHESTVSIDGRVVPGVRRCSVALRQHDAEIILIFGEGVNIDIEAATPHIETKHEGEA